MIALGIVVGVATFLLGDAYGYHRGIKAHYYNKKGGK